MESTAEYKASVKVWQYCPPFLFLFGTFGNLMTVVILRRMNMKRSAMPVFLTALAVSDTCLLYTGLLRRWLIHVIQVDVRTLHTTMCKVHTWLVYSLIIVSAWILTFMTMERTVSVWRPHRVSLLCTRTKATVVVIIIVVTSLVTNCHFLVGMDVVQMGGDGNGSGSVAVCASPDDSYLYFFDAVWSWVDMTLSSILPFTLLLIGNCLILWKVSLSVRAMRHLGSVRPNDVTTRKKAVSSMTVTLMVLSLFFFMTTAPICVYNIVEFYVKRDEEDDPLANGRLQLAWAVVNILMYMNNSVNFYLYCLSGAKFRKELRHCLCSCCSPRPHWPHSKSVNICTLSNNHKRNHHNNYNPDGSRPSVRLETCRQSEGIRECDGGKDMPDSIAQKIHKRIKSSKTPDIYANDSTEF